MAISFNTIPGNIKVPGFYPEVISRDGINNQQTQVLIVGQSTITSAQTPVLITSTDQAKQTFGAGSQAHLMVQAYRLNDPTSSTWVLPLNDAGASVAATGTITFTGAPTIAGTLHLYMGGDYVPVGVNVGDTITVIAANVVAAVNANTSLPVTATSAVGVVTLTAKNKGTLGNSIDVRINHFNELGFEATPTGVTVVIVAMASGATDPTIASVFTTIGDMPVDWFVTNLTDSTSLNTFQTQLSTRWAYNRKLYGHVIGAVGGTVSALVTLGAGRDDKHATLIAATGIPSLPYEVAAATAGALVNAFNSDEAANTANTPILGLTVPRRIDMLTWSDFQNLLSNQIATIYASSGIMRVKRAVTTSDKNDAGFADESWLDLRTVTMTTLVLREAESLITTKFANAKLAADGTQFGSSNVVTPSVVKGEFSALYESWIDRGICQNYAGFLKYSVFELNPTDPNRLDVKLAVTYTNALLITALQLSFSLKA